jgi:Tfp pilus assembly protein PilF
LASCFFCACVPAALAQQGGTVSSGNENHLVNVRLQFYLPHGEPLQQNIRFQLIADDASRPPDYHFTNSAGTVVLYRLEAFSTYIVVVETDGKTWSTTTTRFLVTPGRAPSVQVQLEPFRTERVVSGPTVSAAALQQKVPRDARRKFENAVKQLEKGKYADAEPLLVRAVEIFPDYVDARNELAVTLMKAGKLAEAEQHLRRALQVDSAAVRPLLNLGLCLQRQRRFVDAEPFLEKASQLRPDHAMSLYLLGMNDVLRGKDDDAEPRLVRAYDLGGSNVARTQLLLAQLYTRRKDYPRAAAALETYLRDVPEAPDAAHLQNVLGRLRATFQKTSAP